MLWIALHLPWLSLESFVASLPGGARDEPAALLELRRISAANAAARRLGIEPGLKRATALALAPQLQLGLADASRDAQALLSVAHVALAFTPSVAMPVAGPPSGVALPELLMEVQSSLRLFGGRERLLQRLLAELLPLGHQVTLASAPTALGAAWLAREARPDRPSHVPDLASLRRALDALPLTRLDPWRQHEAAWQDMGLRTLAELRRLPRAGLVRRFGDDLLAQIDRAWGERPDPREWLRPAESFEARLELHSRADHSEQVLPGAQLLLLRLLAWATARQLRVRALQLELRHEPRHRRADEGGDEPPASTQLDLLLAEPSADASHLGHLLRERLARLQLPAPTLEVRLRATQLAHLPPPEGELFPTARSEHEGLLRLVERLQARLGPGGVQRLVTTPDHRPEHACQAEPVTPAMLVRADPLKARRAAARRVHASLAEAPEVDSSGDPATPDALQPAPSPALLASRTGRPRRPSSQPGRNARPLPSSAPTSSASAPQGEAEDSPPGPADVPPATVRPVWLIHPPQALVERQRTPWLDGSPLLLCCGPERIETGWWDDDAALRDYFIARCRDGALVWIYRERRPLDDGQAEGGWFLQGRFG